MTQWFQQLIGELEGLGQVEANAFASVPVGTYQARLLDVIAQPNNKGNPCVVLDFEIASGDFEGKQHRVWRHLTPDTGDNARGSEVGKSVLKGWLIDLGLIGADEDFDFATMAAEMFQLLPEGDKARWKGEIDSDTLFEIKVVDGKPYTDKKTGQAKPGNPDTRFVRTLGKVTAPAKPAATKATPAKVTAPPTLPKPQPKKAAPANGKAKATKPRAAVAAAIAETESEAPANGTEAETPTEEPTAEGESSEAPGASPEELDALVTFGGDPSNLDPQEQKNAVSALKALTQKKNAPLPQAKALAKAFAIQTEGLTVGALNEKLVEFVG